MTNGNSDTHLYGAVLGKLPDDCTIEDIPYHLYVIDKIRRGIEVAKVQGPFTQEEAEKR